MASRIEVRRRADTKRDARAAGVEEDLGKRRAITRQTMINKKNFFLMLLFLKISQSKHFLISKRCKGMYLFQKEKQ